MSRLATRASRDDDDEAEAYALTQALISANILLISADILLISADIFLNLGGFLYEYAGADRAVARCRGARGRHTARTRHALLWTKLGRERRHRAGFYRRRPRAQSEFDPVIARFRARVRASPGTDGC